jgi:hypothetical protein
LRYTFDWDRTKAKQNLRKHRISFEMAAEIFQDASAISVFDEEHSDEEERWVTLGKDSRGRTLVVVHTFSTVSAQEAKIRVISARKAATREVTQYEETKR